MACTYSIAGKEVTEQEYFNYINSTKGLLSIRTESNEDLIARTKEAAKDRFVNMDLFTPLQEQSYTNVIYSLVLDKLGILTPNQEIKVSPAKVFESIRNEFQNGSNKYKVLSERLVTPELLAIAKGNPEMLKKFPELAVYAPEDLKVLAQHYANVADPENFSKFKEQVLVKLSQNGLQVKGKSLVEVGETELSKNEKDQHNNDELDDTKKVINESFEDGQSFKTNPRDTASARVKLFLSSIPSNMKNVFNMREFVSPDEVFEQVMKIGTKLPVINYETFQKALIDESAKTPYLKNVSLKLTDIFNSRNQSFINDFLTVANKAYAEHDLNKWEQVAGGIKNSLFKSNRNSIINQIRTEWLENQKFSDMVKTDNLGNLVIDKDKARELKDQLTAVRNKGILEKREFVKTFFKTIGVDFTEPMINELYKNAESRFFKQYNAKNFSDLFGSRSVFSNIIDKYLSEPSGKAESSYEDNNNAMKDEKVFNDFANIYYNYNSGKYQTSSFRNGEGKSIYSYINPSMLEDVKKKLSNGNEYLQKLARRSFSRSSEPIQKLLKGEGFNFEMRYMDSMVKDGKNSDAKVRKDMSDKEQYADMLWKHQNSGNTSGIYNALTHSDKTTAPTIHFTKYPLEKSKDIAFKNSNLREGSFDYKQPLKDQLYKIASAEIDRMTDHARNPDKLNLKNFNETQNLFYVFPVLNNSEAYPGLKAIHQDIADGKELNTEQQQYVKDVLGESFKHNVLQSFEKWTDIGLFKPVRDAETGEILNYEFPLFNNDYLSKLDGLSGFEKAIHSITDQKLNNLQAQLMYLQVNGMDPALFYKGVKGAHGDAIREAIKDKYDEEGNLVKKGNIQDAPFESKFKAVESTWADFSKRAAMLIAPGSKGVWTWHDSKGNPVDRTAYKAITLDTWKTDTPLFKGVDVTDAQEFITVKEHIDRMMAEGRIPLPLWESISQKVEDAKGGYYELSPEEQKVVFQPTKPVFTLNTDENGFNKIDYVKSSTIPLIPGVTAGQEIDGLRSMMEREGIASANFDSAKKTGQPGAFVQAFDEHGKFTLPEKSVIDKATQNLNRDGLRTQQEIPHQKEEITNISQLNRNLFDGLLDVNDFHITDSTGEKRMFSGQELKQLKENVRINLFDHGQQEVIDRLGLRNEGGRTVFEDNKKLLNLLREEAIKQKYSQNDINSLKLDDKGEFAFPLYLLASGEKFEGLLNSVISSAIQLSNPGTSLVQASGVGTKIDFSKITDKQKSEIIWTSRFDAEKGLQYMREEKGQVKGAQVLVSQFIKDEHGNVIDLKQFVTEKDGRMILDDTKVPEKILQLIGARIPNQNHSSDLPLEVAGFLPHYMANTVIVPDGVTAQMGSDFDVDKLYTYLSTLKFEKGENGKISKLNTVDYDLKKYDGSPQSLKHLDRDQLNELYKDINWNVLTHPKGFDKIARSIDLPEVKDEVKTLNFLNKVDQHWSPLDAEYQIEVFNDNKGGKVGVSIFAALGSFLADNQDKGLFVGRVDHDKNGNRIETRTPIYIKDTDGSLLEMSEISAPGSTKININGKPETRTKSDNNNIALNESVDNAKNKNMGVFNWHPRVLSALAGFISLSTPEGKIHDITFGTRLFLQESIKNYISTIERMTDSFSDDRVSNAHKVVISNLKVHYIDGLSEEARDHYAKDLINSPEKMALSAADLLDMLHMSNDPQFIDYKKGLNHSELSDTDREKYQEMSDDYNLKQLAALDTFDRFDEVGKEIMKANTAAYVYTKGLGSSVFHVNDKIRKLVSLADSSVIGNLENLAGNVYRNASGEIQLDPKGEIGHSLQKSVIMARDIYKSIYPLHFSSAWFDNTVDSIFRLSGFDKNNMGSEAYIQQHRRIFSGVKSYLFSKPELGITDDIQNEREHLLFSRDGNKSLAVRINEMMKDDPELQQNYFLQRLRTKTATIPGEPDTITYQSPFSADIDEQANNKGFVSLILSGKDDQINLAKDLVKYSIVTGNEQNATSFARFIPAEYFLMDKTFTDGLKRLVPDLHDNQEFVRQYIQNNPGNAFKLTDEQHKSLVKPGNKGSFEIPRDNPETQVLEMPKNADELLATDDSKTTKLPELISYRNDKTWELYAKVDGLDGNRYERINTLGTKKAGVVEYAYGTGNLESSIASNRTPAQTLELALRNKDNVYHNLEASKRQYRVIDIAMGDKATQYIGSNPKGVEVVKNDTASNVHLWGDKTNTGEYSSNDKVMVTGGRPGDATDNPVKKLDLEDLDKHFKEQYTPLLDKAMANEAEILVANRLGIDQLTRDYLKANDYTEQRSELGYSTFSRKQDVDPDDIDFDDDHSAIYEQHAQQMDEPAGNNSKAAEILGQQTKVAGSEEDAAEQMEDEPLTGDQRNKLLAMVDQANDGEDTNEAINTNPQESIEDYDFDPDKLVEMSMDRDNEITHDTRDIDLGELDKNAESVATGTASADEIIADYIKDTDGNNDLADVLKNIKTSSDNEFYQTVADIFLKSGGPDVNVVIAKTMADPGRYRNGTVFINPELAMRDNPGLTARENIENTIMHEAVHGYTADLLKRFETDTKSLNDKERLFATALKGLFNHALDHMLNDPLHGENLKKVLDEVKQDDASLSPKDKSLYYGLTNIHEFSSMLLTDNGFQQTMNAIPVSATKNISVMDRFKELLTKLFQHLAEKMGLKKDNQSTVAYEGIKNIVGLVSSRQGDVEEVDMHGDKFNPYKIKTPRGTFDVNEGQRAAIDKISEFLQKPLGKTLDDNIFLLYGAGGTGKTATINNATAKAFEEGSKNYVVFAAPTHTAKGELIRAGNTEAKTLASVLGAKPKIINGEEVFELIPKSEYLREGSILPEIFSLHTLVLDESSMVGQREKEQIEQRLKERGSQIKILFMGDHAQIPPVGDKADRDGFAIDLRKDPEKSIGLTVVERTKNRDITDLGANYRRAVDIYNEDIDKGVSSLNNTLHIHHIVQGEQLTSSENVRYHNNSKEFIDDFLEVFKMDPQNARNAVIITFNNEKHEKVRQITGTIRRELFGKQAEEKMFLNDEPFFITSTIKAKPVKGGEPIEYGTNERMIIKTIRETDKTFHIGSKNFAKRITVPVYDMIAIDKDGQEIKVTAFDRKYSDQMIANNYSKVHAGYVFDDGTVLKYSDLMKLKEIHGLTSIYHGYLLSSHKVQGGTYDHPFVAESNIKNLVGMKGSDGNAIVTAKQYAQTMYTAVSRARDKVYILDPRSDGMPHEFVKPEINKSITSEAIRNDMDLNKFRLENQCI